MLVTSYFVNFSWFGYLSIAALENECELRNIYEMEHFYVISNIQ